MSWEVIFVESKSAKYLDKEEKEKFNWIKKNLKIPILIAYKDSNGHIKYYEYEEPGEDNENTTKEGKTTK